MIEAGNGTLDGVAYTAGVGADIVKGRSNQRSGFPYPISGLTTAGVAVLSQAGMDGLEGSFAVLVDPDAITPTTLNLFVDEDRSYDRERKHTTEQVGYLVFEAGNETPSEATVDHDNDGIPDAWELAHFGTSSISDGMSNADGDAMTDLEEMKAGTDPNDRSSYLTLINMTRNSGGNSFDIMAGSVPCEVWYSPDLSPDSWSRISSGHVTGRYTDAEPERLDRPRAYYRLVTP